MKIGFLSTFDNPLLPYMLSIAQKEKLNNIVIICDGKNVSKKDHAIWLERTGGWFSPYKISNSKYAFYFVENHNSNECLELVESLDLCCLLNAGTPRKLKPSLLSLVKYGVLNIHPGILPAYRGCSCVEWALYNDDQVGNTAHFMDEDYDTGSIICAETYSFRANSSYMDIRSTVYREGCELAIRILKEIFRKKIRPESLSKQGAGRVWPPMPNDIFDKVLVKVNNAQYKYQLEDEKEIRE
jgi:folate-dependent phosphoribosylglycinamide formyltransferase PurN